MSAGTWPEADPRLERGYKRLLLAYPAGYRRRHGTEIVTTLLELAEPDQPRPRGADAWHLVASGLRQRFRLPAGRPLVWPAAVVTAVILAALGAAAGSWLGWQAAPGLPTGDRLAALSQSVAGIVPDGPDAQDSSPWFAARTTVVNTAAPRTAEQIQAGMRAQGWRVDPPVVTEGRGAAYGPTGAAAAVVTAVREFPVELVRVAGYRDGLVINVEQSEPHDPGNGSAAVHVFLDVFPAQPAAVLPLLAAGGLLGGLGGWLLVAALAHRARRRAVAVLAPLSLLVLALPALAVYGNLVLLVRSGSPADQLPYVVHAAFRIGWAPPALGGLGTVLGVAAVLLSLRGRAPAREVVA